MLPVSRAFLHAPSICLLDASHFTQKTLFSTTSFSPKSEFCLDWIFSTSLPVNSLSLVSAAEFLKRVSDSHCPQFLSSSFPLTHSKTTSITDLHVLNPVVGSQAQSLGLFSSCSRYPLADDRESQSCTLSLCLGLPYLYLQPRPLFLRP